MKLTSKKTLIFILLFAFCIRIIGIDRGVWNDEQITLNTLQNNVFLNPFFYGYTTNLPLYFYFLKLWSLSGMVTNIIYLRTFGILINLLNIFILFKHFNKNKVYAILVSIFIAAAPLQIHYAQELRPYILTQLLISLHFIKLVTNLKEKKFRYDKTLTILTILLLLSHYAAYLYLFTSWIILLILKNKNLPTKYNFVNISIIVVFKFIVISQSIFNPKFLESFNNTGITRNNLDVNTIIEMSIRIKEVLTFYYYYGFWYYLTSLQIQSIFKKIFLIILISAVILIIFKYIKNRNSNKSQYISLLILFVVMPTGFLLEKLGVYPFGGRHIMPLSIFLYIPISYFLSWFWLKTIYFKYITIILMSAVTGILVFHQACSISIIRTKDNITHENSYSYCTKKYFNIFQELISF